MHGIPNGRNFPGCPALGMYTRRTAAGSYVFPFSSCASSLNHLSSPYFSNVLEVLSIHTRRALVGLAAGIGMKQNIRPVHLVVQGIEPIARRFLRFGM